MGRRGEEEEREGHVFLTFWMVTGRASAVPDRTSAWTVTFALHGQILFTTSRQKGTFFLLENSTFHLSRTLLLAGS